jgi:putative transcriptional regulator
MLSNTTANRAMNPIRQLRKRLKVSQTELGKEIGVTQSAISQFENGSSIPSPDTVLKIIAFAKRRGVNVSFDSIYSQIPRNGTVDNLAASDDVQPVGGTPSRRIKEARMVGV